MVFPLALLVPWLDWRRGQILPQALKRAWPFLAAAAAVAVVAALSHAELAASWNTTRPGGGGLVRALPTIVWLPLWYLGRTLWPAGPRAIYALDPVGWLDWRLAAAVAVYGLLAFLGLRTRAHRSALIGFVGAYLLPLATVTGAAPMRYHLADRYTLLPSLVVATALVLVARRYLPQVAGAGMLLAALVALTLPNLHRQREWRDGISLWESNVALEPGVWEVHVNLASEYGGAGRWDDAIRHLEEARRLAPQRHRIVGDLFFAHAARAGVPLPRIEAALDSLQRASFSSTTQLDLAAALLREGHPQLVRALLAPLTVDLSPPDAAEAWELISRSHLAQRNFRQAREAASKAVQLAPENGLARSDLVIALAEEGRLSEALRESDRELTNPRDQGFLKAARAVVLFKLDREAEANVLLDEARLLLGPDAPF